MHVRADGLRRGEQAEKRGVAVVAPGHEAAPVGVEAANDDASPGAVAAVSDGVGLDGRGPVGLPGLHGRGPAVDLFLEFVARSSGPMPTTSRACWAARPASPASPYSADSTHALRIPAAAASSNASSVPACGTIR
jgi:hypothetical protein